VPSALSLTFIHPSAWKGNSPKFGCTILHARLPVGFATASLDAIDNQVGHNI
jgi:hypothetical protein